MSGSGILNIFENVKCGDGVDKKKKKKMSCFRAAEKWGNAQRLCRIGENILDDTAVMDKQRYTSL